MCPSCGQPACASSGREQKASGSDGAGWGGGERVFPRGMLGSRGSSCAIPRSQMDGSVVPAGAARTPPPPGRQSLPVVGRGWLSVQACRPQG